ncbi:MAG TPA: hypothetical protein VNO50_02015 [Pyrinomonadaceae bacterium]|nr:hypothetical protein [Pyrinomonadaceae bacterium]
MHCPTCGIDTTLDQRFCRSCGMDLEAVSKLVASHSSPETLTVEKSQIERAAEKRLYRSFKWGMICFLLGMAALATVKTLGFDKTFRLGPLLLLFLGMGIMVFGVLSSLRILASKSTKVLDRERTAELQEAEVTKELPPAGVPVPVASITERTTQLISTQDASKFRE